MALTFFEPKESQGNGDTPFLNEWLERNPKSKQQQFLVKEIIRVKSGKGFLVITDEFSCFIWKNQNLTKFLVEALEKWVQEPIEGYAVYVYLKKLGNPDFTLAADKEQEVTWFSSKNGFTTTELNALSREGTVVDGNPFL